MVGILCDQLIYCKVDLLVYILRLRFARAWFTVRIVGIHKVYSSLIGRTLPGMDISIE